MNFVGRVEPLTIEGLREAANAVGADAAAILAVIEVETSGCGFLPDKRPTILYERHVFSRETNGFFDLAVPDVSSPESGGYGAGGAHQYDRLAKAMVLNEHAALRSTSWGLGQIMGSNAALVGYPDAPNMIADFCDGEDAQIMAIAMFCVRRGIDVHLQRHNWAEFAKAYNGPGYRRNQYDIRLAAAYRKHNVPRSIDLGLRAKQVRLLFAGLYDGRIDGVDGPRTQAALSAAERDGMEVA